MDRRLTYEAPAALLIELDSQSFLCQSQGGAGTFTEQEWQQETYIFL